MFDIHVNQIELIIYLQNLKDGNFDIYNFVCLV